MDKPKKVTNMPFYWNAIKSEWVFSDTSTRLDASFYSRDVGKARILLDKIKKKGIKITTISDFSFTSQIFWPERFKRKYVKEGKGKPFLMPKEVFQFLPQPRKFIVDFSNNLLVKEGWILITRSGSIGRCLLTNKILSLNFVLSDDLIRIIPSNEKEVGYIYTFLNTWIGQAFLTKTQYGETVKHIEPEHIGNIPLPLLPESDIEEIDKKTLEAHKLREEAQELLFKAEKLLHEELDLPIMTEENVNYLGSEKEKSAKAYTVKSQKIFVKNLRLNAISYFPTCLLAESLLEKKEGEGKFKLKKLKEISQKIFTPARFKRIYVKPSEGIPLLQGSHIPMVRYFDLKYISRITENLDSYIIRKDWILVTCSGTVGRVFLTTKFCDGWAATNHMTRIIPSDEVNAGYLTIFLQSSYALSQLEALIYGGVVEEIGEAGELVGEILVPVPSQPIQEKIGRMVVEAYEKKDQANILENQAIKLLEAKLEELAR
jgi:type I restriction enzyme S subunit